MNASVSYSVSELTALIKEHLRSGFPDSVRVQGEIADFTHYRSSGHMYFSLVDEDARLKAVMFRRANRTLDFEPNEGMTVSAEGRLDVYEPRGDYQLIVDRLRPTGVGTLEQQFRELKQSLEAEGALADDRKRSLPELPATVGVVTSDEGAAFWDVVQTIRRRCPLLRVVLYPTRVSGRVAAPEIEHAVRRLPEIVDLDVLIVTRGGGSPEDLWGFNTERVVRAILDCPVPVVSAVGHEVDVTLADLVADHRSPTPTAAGEEIAPTLEELRHHLLRRAQRLQTVYRTQVSQRRDRVRFLAEKPVFSDPHGLLRPFRERLDRLRERLDTHYRFTLSGIRHRLERVSDRLDSLDPKRVLERGYALVSRDGKLITRAEAVEDKDCLTVRWSDGSIQVVAGTSSSRNSS